MTGKIRAYSRGNFRATFDILDVKYPAPDSLIDNTIDRVMIEYFEVGVTEDVLSEATLAFIGDVVTVRLIEPAIDMYQVDSRLGDGANGESVTYYDRITGLIGLRAMIQNRIDLNQSIFEELAGDNLAPTAKVITTPKVSSADSRPRTQDARTFHRINNRFDRRHPFDVPR